MATLATELMSWDSGPTKGSKAICPSFGFPCWAAPVPPGPLYIWAAKRRELLTTFSLALGHTVLNTSAIPSWFYLSPHFSYCKAFQLHEPVPFSSLALFPDPWWPLGLLPNHSRGSNWNTRGPIKQLSGGANLASATLAGTGWNTLEHGGRQHGKTPEKALPWAVASSESELWRLEPVEVLVSRRINCYTGI